MFAFGYWLVENFFGPGIAPKAKAKWLIAAPKILQTGFASLSDWYSWRLAEKLYGHGSVAAWSVVSPFGPPLVTLTHTLVTHTYVLVADDLAKPLAMVYCDEDIL